jgi:hypothetical protein
VLLGEGDAEQVVGPSVLRSVVDTPALGAATPVEAEEVFTAMVRAALDGG